MPSDDHQPSDSISRMTDPAKVKPGPGLRLAIGLLLFLMASQVLASVAAGIAVLAGHHLSTAPQSAHDPRQADDTRESRLDSALRDHNLSAVTLAVSVLTTCVVALGLTAWRYGKEMKRAMAFRWPHPTHLGLVVLLALPAMLVASELGTWSQRFLPQFTGAQDVYTALSRWPWLAVILVGALLPGFGEELFCRGLIGRGLVARYGVVRGIALTSALFGIMHLDPPQAVATAIIAIPFHVAYLCGRSIVLPILAHTLNNALAFTIMRLPTDSRWRLVLGADDMALVPPLVFVSALLSLAALLWLLAATRIRWIDPQGNVWSPGFVTAEMPPAEVKASPQLSRPPLFLVVAALVTVLFLAASIGFAVAAG